MELHSSTVYCSKVKCTSKGTEHLHVSSGWFMGWPIVLGRTFTQCCIWILKCRGSKAAMKENRAGCVGFANHRSQQTLCIKCFIHSMVHLQGIVKTELELFVWPYNGFNSFCPEIGYTKIDYLLVACISLPVWIGVRIILVGHWSTNWIDPDASYFLIHTHTRTHTHIYMRKIYIYFLGRC